MKPAIKYPNHILRCSKYQQSSTLKRSFCTDESLQQIRTEFYSNLCGHFSDTVEIKHISNQPIPQLKSKRKRSQQPTISKGRGIFAKKDIAKGDTVTQEI